MSNGVTLMAQMRCAPDWAQRSNHYWEVRSFYNQSGRAPGQMAIHTWHTSAVSRDMEIDASKSRIDIGRVEVRDSAHGQWRPT